MSDAARAWSQLAGRLPVVLAAALLALPLSAPARAQPAPPAGTGLTGFGAPTREELQRATPPAAPAAETRRARIDASAAALGGSCPQLLIDSEVTAPLTAIAFAGPGAAPLNPRIAALLAPLRQGGGGVVLDGRAQPVRAVCALRDAAQAVLTNAGFIAAVQVPPQTIGGGELKLTVVTARIVEPLRVRGEPGRNRAAIEGLLRRLQALDPLNERDAERLLLLARDIPGTQISLVLRPAGGKPGDIIGEVLLDREPGAVFVNLTDTGSREIGRFGGLVRGEIYGLTGLADRTTLGVYATADVKEQIVLQAGHDFGLGSSGLRLSAQAAYAWTRPSIDLAGFGTLDLRSESLLVSTGLSYPLLRRVDRNIYAGGGFELIDQDTTIGGSPLSTDRLRIFYARIDGGIAERAGALPAHWSFGGSFELRKGADIFGASRMGGTATVATSRFEGDPQAFVMRGQVNGEARLRFGESQTRAVTLALTGRGQWADHPLLAYEELAVGNLTIGRGYDPGATSADRAYGGTAELRIGKPYPSSTRDGSLEVFGFVDAVRIHNLDQTTSETDRNLVSFGGGVRAAWGNRARIELTYAHPVDKALSTDTNRPPDRLLLTLTVRAWPW